MAKNPKTIEETIVQDEQIEALLQDAPEPAPEPEAPEPAQIGDNNPPKYSLKKLLADAKKFGDAAGKGDAALPSLALEVASASYEGVINIAGAGDDVEAIFQSYMAARTKQAAVGSLAQQVSKLRSIAKAGQFAGTDDDGALRTVADVFEDANQMHIDAYNNADLRKQMVKGSRYDFLLKVAREQLKLIGDAPRVADVPLLSIDQLNEFLFPVDAEPKTIADKVWKVLKDMQKLKDGKKDKDGNVDQPPLNEPELDDAIANVQQLLWKVDPVGMEKAAQEEKQKAQVQQLAAALGLRVSVARKAA